MDPLNRAREARLMTLYHRLEAATSRLEDMALSVEPEHAETIAAIQKSGSSPAEDPSASTLSITPQEPVPATVEAFDAIIEKEVKYFVTTSEKLGGLVEEQVS